MWPCQQLIIRHIDAMDLATMITGPDIRQARKRINETQEQFARRFGVDRTTLIGWELHGPPKIGPAAILLERTLRELSDVASAAVDGSGA